MSTIIKYQSHVNNAKAFSERYSVLNASTLYLSLAKSTAWENGDENPTAPLDNIDDENLLWSEMIGMQKVAVSNIMMAIPRINWAQGVAYTPLSTSSTTAYTDLPGSYVYVVDGLDFNVYKCVVANGVTGSVAPTGQAASPVTTPDGFQWQYMYNLTAIQQRDLLTEEWLPVPTENIVEPQLSFGDPLAYKTLGSRYMLVNIVLTEPNAGGLPSVSYRKVSLISNPLDNLGAAATGGVILPAGLSTDLSGIMVHLDHRFAVTRIDDQSEEMTIILEF